MPEPEVTHAHEVQARLHELRRLAAQSSQHRAPHAQPRDATRVIEGLRRAALLLCDGQGPLGQRVRHELQVETGLSAPVIEWGLLTSLTSLRHAPLFELERALPVERAREVIGVVLAGNVFAAALRGLSLPLLAGAHVLAKTASGEGAFARAWQAALATVDPALGRRLALVEFPRQDAAAAAALCAGVDALSVYGDDASIAQLGRLLAPHARLVAHGHGLSAAYVTRQQLATAEQAERAAERVALDVSAYDQRGCLSPQVVCVEGGAAVEPAEFARLLAQRALPLLAQLLPPSAASTGSNIGSNVGLQERAARMQWEASAAVRGELWSHPTHAVSFEPGPLRPSPGGRLVSVYACADHAELRELLEPWGAHLKSVGVAGSKTERAAISYLLSQFCRAGVCMSGEMQTPAFDAWADGAPPLDGLWRR